MLPLNRKLIYCTDGLRKPGEWIKEMSGLKRLKQNFLEMGRSLNAKTLGQAQKNNVKAYLNDYELTDDFILVIIQVEP